MSDIVERIRNRINDAPMPTEHLLDEAADTITALRAEVDRLRDALEAVTKVRVNGWDNIWAGANRCRDIALAALTQTKDTTDDA